MKTEQINRRIVEKLIDRDLRQNVNSLIDHLFKHCYEELEDELCSLCDAEEKEVAQYWAITPQMGEKLKESGELVGYVLDLTIWCRKGCGYALEDDFEPIAKKMEILDGQKYSWKNSVLA